MEQSKIQNLNPQDYTHLPHADQQFEAHEQTDVAIKPLVATLVTIALTIIITAVGMWGLFEVFKRSSDSAPDNQMMSAVRDPDLRQVPEGFPVLQGITARGGNPNSPAMDMNEMRTHNDALLTGHASLRAGMGPGMPIEQAMDEALARGIFKTATTAPTTGPTTQSH